VSFKTADPLSTGFAGSRIIVKIRSTRTEKKSGKTSVEERHYLSSQEWSERSPECWINLSRSHWAGVENRNHYRRDATLGEDGTRCRHAKLLANMALLRSVCLLMYSRMGSIDGYLPARREGLCAQPMLAKQLINQKI
jgi:predicted transposase YbfD/YdcC